MHTYAYIFYYKEELGMTTVTYRLFARTKCTWHAHASMPGRHTAIMM